MIDKCDKCARNGQICNGERPCQNCKFFPLYFPYGQQPPDRCVGYTVGTGNCNSERPCNVCRNHYQKKFCLYEDTERLLILRYPVKETEIEQCAKAPDSCRSCRTVELEYKKRASLGRKSVSIPCGTRVPDTPCLPCVRNKAYIAWCTWDEEGLSTKIPTQPWSIVTGDDGIDFAVLDTSFRSWTKTEISQALAPGGRLAGYYAPSQASDRNLSRHIQNQGKAVRPTDDYEYIEGHLHTGSAFLHPRREAEREALTAYNSLFPYGADVIPTSGVDLQCAFNAIINSLQSMRDQGVQVPVPTLTELQDIFDDVNFQSEMRAFETGFVNAERRNYRVDQAGGVINWWASIFHNTSLRMGWVVDERRPWLTPFQDLLDIGQPPIYFFIHNNTTGDEGMNHFSGLRPRPEKIPIDPALLQELSPEHDSEDDDNQSEIIQLNDISIRDTTKASRKKISAWQFTGLAKALDLVDLAHSPPPESRTEALSAPDATHWALSMNTEYSSLVDNNVLLETVLPADKQAITVKWVFKRKLNRQGEIEKWKSRLVARGFQQIEGVDFYESYAPVAKHSSYRVLFTISARKAWHVMQMDAVTAFLNSNLEEEVYIRSIPGYPVQKGHVFRLRKALYGLKQASRAWYLLLLKNLIDMGWRMSSNDDCVFVHDELSIYLLLWVDDFIFFGPNRDNITDRQRALASVFKMTDIGDCSWVLGMHIDKTANGIHVDQAQYIMQRLQRYGYPSHVHASMPMNPKQKLAKYGEATTQSSFPPGETYVPPATDEFRRLYQSKVSTLNYSATISRPDIAYAVSTVARYNANPQQAHMDAVDHLFTYTFGTRDVGLRFTSLEKLELVGFVDSDFAGCVDSRQSTTGYIFLFGGTAIAWKSARQTITATSTCEAEYIALGHATKEAMFLRNFINNLNIPGEQPIVSTSIYIDNDAAHSVATSVGSSSKLRHLETGYHFVREKIAEGVIHLLRVDSEHNIADMLTKALHGPRLQYLCDLAGIKV